MHGIYKQLEKDDMLKDIESNGKSIYELVKCHNNSTQYNEKQYGLHSSGFLLQVDEETYSGKTRYTVIITSGGSNRHSLGSARFLELLQENF